MVDSLRAIRLSKGSKRFFRLFLLVFICSYNSALAQNWLPVGDGFNREPKNLFVEPLQNKLYAIGNFDSSGATPLPYAAILDGTKWDSIPFLNGNYLDWNIVSYKSKIYFTSVGSLILQWDGLSLDTLGVTKYTDGGAGHTEVLYVYENELIILGEFDSINGMYANNMVAWNGSDWRVFDTTVWVGGYFNNLMEYQGDLYMTGQMFKWDGSIKQIARWDGSVWHSVGNGIVGGFSGAGTMAVYQGDLYFGGVFNTAQGNPGNAVARWDGNQWKDASPGMTSQNAIIFDLEVYDGYLYACGQFTTMGGYPISSIARWDGQQWCGLIQEFEPWGASVLAMAVYNNELYIGGNFVSLDGDTVNRIAKWVGGNLTTICTEPIGIQETALSLLTLHPNPATTHITITGVAPNTTATITNLHGQEVLQSAIRNPQSEISVEALPAGLYFFIVESRQERKVLRFVKQ